MLGSQCMWVCLHFLYIKTYQEHVRNQTIYMACLEWRHSGHSSSPGWYPSETHFNSNLAKSRLSITSVSIVQSFWNFAQQYHFRVLWKISKRLQMNKLWTNEISRDFSLSWVSDGYPILHITLWFVQMIVLDKPYIVLYRSAMYAAVAPFTNMV